MPGYALLPCPFCGSIEIEWQSYLGNKMLRCQGCGILTNDKADEESLIAAWNRRSPARHEGMIKCRVLMEGWRHHSEANWYRRGWADLTAHPRWDTWKQDHGFRADEVRAAMERFDMEGLDSITLVDP